MNEVLTDLRIERRFPAPPELVFEFVTRSDRLMQWWGPEGMSVADAQLDFSKPGPWHSVIVNADGKRFKMSGVVTEIDPPRAVAFTWGWHDETGARGPESVVRIEFTPAGADATDFTLIHSGLPDDESRSNHNMGWTSSLGKLERQFT